MEAIPSISPLLFFFDEVIMREVMSEIDAWREAGKHIGLATNVRRNGMTLRPLGAKMAMTTGMEISGSVTGGCVESAVYEEAQSVIKTGQPKLLHFGVSGEVKPWDIGLTCGTSLDIFVESLDSPIWDELYPYIKTCVEKNKRAAIVTAVTGTTIGRKLMVWPDGGMIGSLGSPTLNNTIKDWALNQMPAGESTCSEFPLEDEIMDVFMDILEPMPRLIVVGASHLAIPLVAMGKVMGFKTIVVDPRKAFATKERFPDVDELITEWPSTALEGLDLDEASYVAVISHDDKLDNPALAVALTRPSRFVGVLGTRKRIPWRMEELKKMGVNEEQLTKLHAPIGQPLGATLPEEIAVSILSEMVAVRHGIGDRVRLPVELTAVAA
jgi:xanthine dehydrogenase accessory factor